MHRVILTPLNYPDKIAAIMDSRQLTAFSGSRIVAAGEVDGLVEQLKAPFDRGQAGDILIFQDETGRQVDFDLRGSLAEVLARVAVHPLFSTQPAVVAPARTGPGRPKLGVVSREVSLLPRQWEWLEQQPNGISAALRRIVDEARKAHPEQERARRAKDATNRVMGSLAGNLPGYEEASRALYAGNGPEFERHVADWPEDVRDYVKRLAADAFVGTAA